MRRAVAIGWCCTYWAVKESSSFLIAPSIARDLSRGHDKERFTTNSARKYFNRNNVVGDTTLHERSGRTKCHPEPSIPTSTKRWQASATPTTRKLYRWDESAMKSRSEWLKGLPAALLLALSGVAAANAPLRAIADGDVPSEQVRRPIVEALVQLPEGAVDWKSLVPDVEQARGANLLITAKQRGSGAAVLGATVAMDRLRFPVMMQLFPTNIVGGAKWPGDFEERGAFDIEISICGGDEARGVRCKSPSLGGSGASTFVTQLEDVPEVAEGGGMRLPATVILSSPES